MPYRLNIEDDWDLLPISGVVAGSANTFPEANFLIFLNSPAGFQEPSAL
jgi:hypothetical protein